MVLRSKTPHFVLTVVREWKIKFTIKNQREFYLYGDNDNYAQINKNLSLNDKNAILLLKFFKMELENYTWQKDKATNEYLNKPIDEFNHLLDAFRYSLEDVMPRNRISSISKQMLGF